MKCMKGERRGGDMQSSKVSKLFQAVCPQQQDQRHGGRNVACFQRLTRIVVLYNISLFFLSSLFFLPSSKRAHRLLSTELCFDARVPPNSTSRSCLVGALVCRRVSYVSLAQGAVGRLCISHATPSVRFDATTEKRAGGHMEHRHSCPQVAMRNSTPL